MEVIEASYVVTQMKFWALVDILIFLFVSARVRFTFD